ncbi:MULTISPECIES: helix-turn-helix domain-containing protein [unclassified Nostoc]|uniref:TetR/AcrR family transcriptional regulator n=1 Tax=unclassified Nostoc TaxID=2593658 RepID=UPI002AD45548|nr:MULTISPECIES: helix-turn-helix domain-containing protein [unclassified Nostoc]MDZ8123920.1 helix-turn-helix domain-containing protein [Nostoc sp. CmiVER01]MDZ8225580.1 helix-turn-helix domain-containing protein [Nostoc sp. ChiVER01]
MENLASRTAQTHARLIKAATQVFARAGLTRVITQEIARVAVVNEVTLFRHFQTKEQLLAAVITKAMPSAGYAYALQTEAVAHHNNWTQELHIELKNYAKLCNQMIEEHEDLIRTFIEEAKRHPQATRLILYKNDTSLREQLVGYLQKNQEKGTMPSDIDLKASVDSFKGMLLHGMLRFSHIPTALEYSRECYIETCVNLFVRYRKIASSVDSFVTRSTLFYL